MIALEKINDGCDIKAEVIAADLIERGIDSSKIAILPMGSFSRNYRKDVVSFAEVNTYSADSYYTLNVSRDGIYEHLPQALFHQTVKRDIGKSKSFEDRLDDIKRVKAEQAEAKKAFAVIEREINQSRIVIELKERNSIFGLTEDSHSDLFLDVWPEIKEIEEKYRKFLFQILPLAHKCRNNIRLSEALLSYVLNLPVQITSDCNPYYLDADEEVSKSYGYYLGIDSILGRRNPVYEELYTISVNEVPVENLRDYMYGGGSRNVILFLLEYFLPFDADFNLDIHVKEEESKLVLNDGTNYSYLNYNSTL